MTDMNIERDNFYTTRDGTKVRIVCVDAGGPQPVIAVDDGGDVSTHTIDGRYYVDNLKNNLDIIGPWVEPVKPLELWVNVYNAPAWGGGSFTYHSQDEAKRNSYGAERIAVHMREVMP